jgi:[protein-PII] uridylyltransferase
MELALSEQWCNGASRLIDKGLSGKSITFHLTAQIDKVLSSAFKQATSDFKNGDGPGHLALVAIGGYGRSEMVPYSDIDIMLLSRQRDTRSTESAQSVLYKLWDMGLNISHCFRTFDECVQDSVKDPKTRTAIIDSRFLAGSAMVYDEFKRDIYPKILFKKKRDFVSGMLSEISERHRTFEDSVYLLEPNIKDGIGGLRDVHTLTWLSKVVLSINDISGLRTVLSGPDYLHLIKAFEFLLKIRLALHIISKRRNDVLSFEFHEEASRIMGFKDTRRFMGAEIMMRLFYKKAEAVSGALTRVMKISGSKYIPLPFSMSIKRITDDFFLTRNGIAVKDKGIFKNVDNIMTAFNLYSVSGKKFSDQVRESIRGRALFVNRKTRLSKKSVSSFLEILQGNRVYETLRQMHETGILDRFIPEFGRLRHLVIYEIYHRYTVDEHSLIAVKNLEALKDMRQPRPAYLAEIFRNTRQDLLYLALLLHDIGKGGHERGGSHEGQGYKLLKPVLERLGIEHRERSKVEFVVKHHVLLPKLALNRDSEAQDTVNQLAEVVENQENLDALYLVTYADMRAVKPDFWTDWKAYLLHDLYTRTKDHLLGVSAKQYRTSDRKLQEFIESMPGRYIISTTDEILRADYALAVRAGKELLSLEVNKRTDGTAEITIATEDRPGLFSRIAGVLSSRGFNILRARIYTSDKALALDKILLSNWSLIWWEGLEEQLKKDLYNAIILDVPSSYDRGVPKRPYAGRRLETFIEIENEASSSHTLLELLLPDRMGLLSDIAEHLYRRKIDITSAVINTEEGIAQDVFYLQHDGGKLTTDFVFGLLRDLYDSEIYKRQVMGDR